MGIISLANVCSRIGWCAILLVIAIMVSRASTPAKMQVNPIDGAEMVLIPAGEFLMGITDDEVAAQVKAYPTYTAAMFAREQPAHRVVLDAYYLYKTEVTVAQYRKFCAATRRVMPKLSDEWMRQAINPIVNVSWEDAAAYATWAGASLPTEAQWENATRGGDRRLYPWGDVWPPSKGAGNFCDQTLNRNFPVVKHYIENYDDGFVNAAPIASFPANPYGVYDLAGNVEEWCADWYSEMYYRTSPVQNPAGPSEAEATLVKSEGQEVKQRVVRGTNWFCWGSSLFLASFRSASSPMEATCYRGFRCVIRVPGS